MIIKAVGPGTVVLTGYLAMAAFLALSLIHLMLDSGDHRAVKMLGK